jgi:hypothetical protein
MSYWSVLINRISVTSAKRCISALRWQRYKGRFGAAGPFAAEYPLPPTCPRSPPVNAFTSHAIAAVYREHGSDKGNELLQEALSQLPVADAVILYEQVVALVLEAPDKSHQENRQEVILNQLRDADSQVPDDDASYWDRLRDAIKV